MRARFWIESVAGGLSGFLCLLTLVWRDWIEGVFGWNPDQHNSSAEWEIAVALLGVALVLAFLARRELHRGVAQATS